HPLIAASQPAARNLRPATCGIAGDTPRCPFTRIPRHPEGERGNKPTMGLQPMASFLPSMRSTTELRGRGVKWARQDSNLRRLPPADLQSAPFAARDTDPRVTSRRWDLNP